MPSRRRPPTLVFDGSFVVIPGWAADYLEHHAGLGEFRVQNSGKSPDLDHVLDAMRIAGLRWRASSARGTAPAPQATPGEALSMSGMMPASQAAESLGMTSRGVTKACDAGRLSGHKIGGRWWIHPADVEHFRAGKESDD
jgi:uncharacterized protein (DUF2342 family)